MKGTRESLTQAVEDYRRYDGGYGAGNLCLEGNKYFFTGASEDWYPATIVDLWSTVEWMDEEWPDNPEWALDWLEEELTKKERGMKPYFQAHVKHFTARVDDDTGRLIVACRHLHRTGRAAQACAERLARRHGWKPRQKL